MASSLAQVSMGQWFVFALLWVTMAGWAAHVASEKGREGVAYFFMSLLFGPLPFVAALGLPVKHDVADAQLLRDGKRKRCESCATYIYPEAQICPACHRDCATPTPTEPAITILG